MSRISHIDVGNQVNKINDILGLTQDDKEFYEVEYGFGGLRIVQNKGAVNVLNVGYCSTREVYNGLQYFIAGLLARNEIPHFNFN